MSLLSKGKIDQLPEALECDKESVREPKESEDVVKALEMLDGPVSNERKIESL